MLLVWLLTNHIILADSNPFYCEKKTCPELYQYPLRCVDSNCQENLNVMSTAQEILARSNYAFEEHLVTTDDGYILTVFRIPPKENDTRKNKQPVILQHGLLVDGDIWLNIGNRSFAYALADQGYDVWVGNQRGTKYGRRNIYYETSEQEFWNYNLDDLAKYDLRAMLQKVAKITQKAGSIIYIGHSRGSTIMFMYASEYTEEAKALVKGFVALSPIAYTDVPFPTGPNVRFFSVLGKIFEFLHINSVFYHSKAFIAVEQTLCPLFPYVCREFLNWVYGRSNQFAPYDLLIHFSNLPTASSIHELLQFATIYRTNKFQKYDFGREKNLEKYGQVTPPLYNLSKIVIPVQLYYGKNDVLATEKTVKRIFDELTTDKEMKSVPFGIDDETYQYNHIDFTISENLHPFFYDGLWLMMKEWSI